MISRTDRSIENREVGNCFPFGIKLLRRKSSGRSSVDLVQVSDSQANDNILDSITLAFKVMLCYSSRGACHELDLQLNVRKKHLIGAIVVLGYYANTIE